MVVEFKKQSLNLGSTINDNTIYIVFRNGTQFNFLRGVFHERGEEKNQKDY